MMPRYAELVYNGFWFSPERLAMQAAIDTTQQFVEGTVRLKLYKVRRGLGSNMPGGWGVGGVYNTGSAAPEDSVRCLRGALLSARHVDE
jgi:hypothetical protein